MADNNPPIKQAGFNGSVQLEDYANPGRIKENPTIAAGDVQVQKDSGSFNNLGTLPTVSGGSGKNYSVDYALSSGASGETDVTKKVTIIFHDQTEPPEWADYTIEIQFQDP
jgi:hypothetical protein